jgi:hypothetical protein
MDSHYFKTISASYKTRKPTFLVELENGHLRLALKEKILTTISSP